MSIYNQKREIYSSFCTKPEYINKLYLIVVEPPKKRKNKREKALQKTVTEMTEKDLGTLKMLSENFNKGNDEGINYLASDKTTYSEIEYDELEKELESKIADTILEFKNKYLVLPFIKIEDSEIVRVSLKMNRYLINTTTLYNQILERQNENQKSNL